MSRLEYQYDAAAIEIEFDSDVALVADDRFVHFAASLLKFHDIANLVRFSVTRQESPATDYVYQFEDNRGHVWTQTFHNPLQADYETSGQFDSFPHVGCIHQHRVVIEHVITLIRGYGISKIEATWE